MFPLSSCVRTWARGSLGWNLTTLGWGAVRIPKECKVAWPLWGEMDIWFPNHVGINSAAPCKESVLPLFSNWNLSLDFQMSSARAFKHNFKWDLLGLEESAFIITKNSCVSRVNLTSDLSVSLIHYAIIIIRVILIFLCNFPRI